jgi:Malectin domain
VTRPAAPTAQKDTKQKVIMDISHITGPVNASPLGTTPNSGRRTTSSSSARPTRRTALLAVGSLLAAATLNATATGASAAPVVSPAHITIHVDAGSSTTNTAPNGVTYAASTGFTGGRAGSLPSAAVSGALGNTIMRTTWVGMTSWRGTVPNGTYDVSLHMSENYWNSASMRLFSAKAENVTMFTNLDVYATAGAKKQLTKTVRVNVTDGAVDIYWTPAKDMPVVSAIDVTPINLATPPAPTNPSAFPTATSVGWKTTGVTLKTYTGPNEITVAGTIIDGADITVPLIVSANNVTIRNSRITSPTAWYSVRQYPEFSHLTLDHVEIVNKAGEHPDWAIYAGPYLTVRSSLIHGMQRGVYASSNMTITGSYLDDFDNPSTSHAQAILSSGNVHNVTLTNNTLGCHTNLCTAALSIFPETWTGGPNDTWMIDHNQLNGGSYAIYAGYTASAGESPNTNMTFINNVFGTKYYPTCGEFGRVGSWSNVTSNRWNNNTTQTGQIVLP